MFLLDARCTVVCLHRFDESGESVQYCVLRCIDNSRSGKGNGDASRLCSKRNFQLLHYIIQRNDYFDTKNSECDRNSNVNRSFDYILHRNQFTKECG